MDDSGAILEIRDNGGRRTGIDRRHYSYSGHIPERRSGVDRRKLEDRRQDFKLFEHQAENGNYERRKAMKGLAC